MDLNFITDPNLVPKPRDQIQIQTIKLLPYPDKRRIHVEIEITPFAPTDRPNLEIVAHSEDGSEIASLNVVETMHRAIGLTIHLRQPGSTDGRYTFTANLFYEPGIIQHSLEATVSIPDDITDTKV